MALKKSKPSVRTLSLGWVKLWRDDVAEMVDVMLEAARPDESLIIQIGDDYTATAVDDLAEHPDSRVDQFIALVGSGRIRLVLSATEATLEIVEPDLVGVGMSMKVWAIAERCRTRSLLLRRAVELLLETVLLAFTFSGGKLPRISKSGAEIFTKTRVEAPSFWARKRDDVMLAIVSALVGGVIGYFVNVIS